MPGIKYESEPQLNWVVGFTREGKIFALSPCLSSSQRIDKTVELATTTDE